MAQSIVKRRIGPRAARLSVALGFLLVLPPSGLRAGESGGQPGAFLQYGVGARALGMGGAFYAIADDATAAYWNPAGLAYLQRKEVTYMSAPMFADTVLGYMLAFARRGPWMDKTMKSGKWEKIPGKTLSECTLGIIGVGNIGKAVTRRARAFGMKVLGTDIIDIDHVFVSESGIHMTDLNSLLSDSDFVSMNCDLNPTSYHLINAETLAQMKSTAILINTARGPIVEENALVAALGSGQVGGAALDVFEFEPLPKDSPLLKMDNVMLAPHNSNSSPTAWERIHWNTIRNLLDGLGIQYLYTDFTDNTE